MLLEHIWLGNAVLCFSWEPSVTNFDLGSLIEQNNLSEDSCLLVVDNKVYDLTLCLQDHLSCNLQHAPLADDNEPADTLLSLMIPPKKQISSSRSTNTAGPPIHRPTPAAQPSHLDRANELVRLSKQRVIDAQRGVGVANLSLADAFAQLVEAEKVKDHLVLQASEGYRPIWPAWLNENNQ
ncbi:hypothetical protein PtA15_4A214 [Puccinia triticina]|uniref:Uncharacterized protein n=1 Tax=Puccinia triticina TaxID=208348 RepID=A0ABY7CEX7_9BASI|nr:uncharacterized protein PtA15_4A214 [Puccinia triticina]WAQ83766.1 hypothetical protein PtA15_4A214 [Puccinia triticina]